MTPNAAIVSARLQELASQMNTGLTYDPDRPANAATAKQLAYLTTLIHQHGTTEYKRVKATLSITEPLSRMTRREAWLVIQHLRRER